MASITTFFGTQGGGGSISGSAGQIAYFDSSTSITGDSAMYYDTVEDSVILGDLAPAPSSAASRLVLFGKSDSGYSVLRVCTGTIWGSQVIMLIHERGLMKLNSFSQTGTSTENIFIGESAGSSHTDTGIKNVIIGNGIAGTALTTGQLNTVVGHDSMLSITTGVQNTAIGGLAMTALVSGGFNVAVGTSALRLCTGSSNVAVGSTAGREITNRSENTFIGDSAGRYRGASPSTSTNTNCSQSVYLGASTRSNSDGGATNEIVIGYNATGNGSNSVTLGDTTVTNTYLRGNIRLTDGQSIITGSTTGTIIGSSPSNKLSLWGNTPIVQPTTAGGSATVSSPGAGSTIKTDDTFDGYTLAQVVRALRNIGVLQ